MQNNTGNPEKQPPLHARLYWYQLTSGELAVTKALVEHNWDGSIMWPSLERLAAYCKLSRRQVQRVIHGWDEKRKSPSGSWVTKKHNPGLIERGILSELAPSSRSARKPATYRLNEAALTVDPRMKKYIEEEKQTVLPGVHRPSVPGEPIRPRQKVLPGLSRPRGLTQRSLVMDHRDHREAVTLDTVSYGTPDTMSTIGLSSHRTLCPGTTDTVSTDSLIDSRRARGEVRGPESRCSIIATDELTTTTCADIEKLAKGLRDILPSLDDAAIRMIWKGCRANAPDCTTEEVIHFAWLKASSVKAANNPSGLMITAVQRCFEGSLLQDHRRGISADARTQRHDEKAAEGMNQLAEGRRKMREASKEKARMEIEQMPAAELATLRRRAEVELLRQCPQARTWSEPDRNRTISGYMLQIHETAMLKSVSN